MENIDFEKLLRDIYLCLEKDSWGYWTPEWCIVEGEDKPSFEEFIDFIKERSKTK